MLGGLQEKERVVRESDTFSNLSTGWAAEGTPQLQQTHQSPTHDHNRAGIEQD